MNSCTILHNVVCRDMFEEKARRGQNGMVNAVFYGVLTKKTIIYVNQLSSYVPYFMSCFQIAYMTLTQTNKIHETNV